MKLQKKNVNNCVSLDLSLEEGQCRANDNMLYRYDESESDFIFPINECITYYIYGSDTYTDKIRFFN